MLIDLLADLADYAHRNAWMDDALCSQVDPELFFPEAGSSGADARRVCKGCPVRLRCLQDALDRDDQHGIWGGMTTAERNRLRGLGLAA